MGMRLLNVKVIHFDTGVRSSSHVARQASLATVNAGKSL